jgi:hypothetical protein
VYVPSFRSPQKLLNLVWIDALCIDQSSFEERNSQVKLMRNIYESSSEVLVWLGPASDNSALAASFLPHITKTLSKLPELFHSSIGTLHHHPSVPGEDDPRWKALLQLLCRPWFSRIWVQQEIMLAPVVSMACGPTSIQWDDLCGIVNIIYDHQLHGLMIRAMEELGNHAVLRNSITIIHYIWWARRGSHLTGRPSLLEHLTNFCICDATDPKDMIFSLLGISSSLATDVLDAYTRSELIKNLDNTSSQGLNTVSVPGTHKPWKQSINIDYGSSTEELYIDFAKSALIDHHSSALLPCARHSESTNNLPSWVPDWHKYGSGPTLWDWQGHAGYKACGISKVRARSSENKREVFLTGFWVDEIISVSPLLQSEDFPGPSQGPRDPPSLEALRNWLTAVENLAVSHKRYITGETGLKSCWRTLQANMTWEGYPLPTDWNLEERDLLESYLADDDDKHGTTSKPASSLWTDDQWIVYERTMSALKTTIADRIYRTFCVSRSGYMGLVPAQSQAGNFICVFGGHTSPFVIRNASSTTHSVGGSERYQLVGECYVNGIMGGEIVQDESRPSRDFLLV